MIVLLCAVALGILGMHGLAAGPASGGHAGHHATSTTTAATDTAADMVGSAVAMVGDETPAGEPPGLLALCMLMLAPALALGLWLVATAAGRGSWRLPRPATRVVTSLDVAALPPPFERQLTVLRV